LLENTEQTTQLLKAEHNPFYSLRICSVNVFSIVVVGKNPLYTTTTSGKRLNLFSIFSILEEDTAPLLIIYLNKLQKTAFWIQHQLKIALWLYKPPQAVQSNRSRVYLQEIVLSTHHIQQVEGLWKNLQTMLFQSSSATTDG
jgi:hypothetical protein